MIMYVYVSSNGKMTTPISKHTDLEHNFDISVVKFLVLEHIPDNRRGGRYRYNHRTKGNEMDIHIECNL